ncbi:uncharacterized protein KY384_004651 [Bacidia gigantensis]|uniref:uncharacterized protein n=1 Tax=Bacidia gigantensis TaxID=2732470 RepID=UPI001D044CE4|nr:uncharacterized protein KY384_004651 [Bacidia gigantensis]KAG8530613.1 hypothetical protein KY384_004651 [Bacidia gigantensis]
MNDLSDYSRPLGLPTPPLSAPLSQSCNASTHIESWLDNILSTHQHRKLKRSYQQTCQPESENLPKLVRRSARLAQTGLKSGAMPPRVDQIKNSVNAPATPPQSSLSSGVLHTRAPTSGTASTTKDPNEVRLRLEKHHMYQEKGHFQEHYKDFSNTIDEKIGRVLPIEMGQESVERFERAYKETQGDNEDSYLNAIIPLLAPRYRKVPDAPEQEVWEELPAGPVLPHRRYKLRGWDEEGVKMLLNPLFKDGFVPFCGEDDILAKELKKEDSITNPKPDRVFGLKQEIFRLPAGCRAYENMERLLALIAGMCHAFFLIEGKSNKGLLAAANNQACRAGATLVSVLRIFLDAIGVEDIAEGLDERTFVYSMTIDSNVASIWVHFAEKQSDGTVHFHMEYVTGALLRSRNDIPRMQRCIDNIQSWGCTERKNELLKYHKEYLIPHLRDVETGRLAERELKFERMVLEKATAAEKEAMNKQTKAAERKAAVEGNKAAAEKKKKPQAAAPSTRMGLRSQDKEKK